MVEARVMAARMVEARVMEARAVGGEGGGGEGGGGDAHAEALDRVTEALKRQHVFGRGRCSPVDVRVGTEGSGGRR